MKSLLHLQLLLQVLLLRVLIPVNSSRQSIQVRKIHFTKSLGSCTLQTYVGISVVDCAKTCTRIKACKSVSYRRQSKVCELSVADQEISPDSLLTKTGSVVSLKSDWIFKATEYCASCLDNELCISSSSCEMFSCPTPHPTEGARILGNLFYVGSKRLYTCSNGAHEVSVCQADGNWSSVTTTCSTTCEPLVIENASVTITEAAETGEIEANIICNLGYFHRSINKVYCNATSLKWVNMEQVGCIEIYVEPWTIVYRLLGGRKPRNPYKIWKSNEVDLLPGDFRNDDVLSSWNGSAIKQVKLDVIGFSDELVASLVFDGNGTDKENWFSVEKLINSSWADLTKESLTQKFSIKGVRAQHLRWAILDISENSTNDLDCSVDLVWLTAIRSKHYPCDKQAIGIKTGNQNRVFIVYSKGRNGTLWEGGELALAKEMMVSVLRTT